MMRLPKEIDIFQETIVHPFAQYVQVEGRTHFY